MHFSHGCLGSWLPSLPLPSLCEIGPLNHTVPLHPMPHCHGGVTSARAGFCHKSWLYFMLQRTLFTRAKTSSLGALHQVNFYVLFAQTRVTDWGNWKHLSEVFVEYFLSLSIEESVKVSIGVGNSSVLAMRKIYAFFWVVMKFAKLLMSALVSLSDDLVPVELFHLSC